MCARRREQTEKEKKKIRRREKEMHVSIPGSLGRAARRTKAETEHLSATTPQ